MPQWIKMAELWEALSVPSTLEIRRSERFGRGVYAKTGIRLGAEALRAEPYVHVLSTAQRGVSCDCCFKDSDSLSKCSQCKFVGYCGKDCQRRDWPLHKGECKGIARIHPNTPSDTMRLMIRVLQRKKQGKKQKLPENAEWEMDILSSHGAHLGEDVEEEVRGQILGVQKLLEGASDVDPKLLYDIICKLLCNTFTVCNSDLNSIGAAIYIGSAMLNHSCDPNCVVVFDGPVLSLKAIRHIEAGEQLFISYIELLDTKQQRQAQLKRVYHFDCSCQRCQIEMDKDSPYKMMYGTKTSDTPVYQRDAVMKEGLHKLCEIEGLRKKAEWRGVVGLCQRSLSEQGTVLHPSNVVTAKTLETLLDAYIELEEWAKALETAEKLTEPYKQYLPQNHPASATHLAKLGKLRMLNGSTEQLELSIRDLTQSVDQLCVIYGRQHYTTQKAIEMLQDSQRELVQRKMQLLNHS